MRIPALLVTLLLATSAAAHDPAPVNVVIDAWHTAASKADEAAYFGAMAPEFVFLGTDATERWDLEAFRAFARPYFSKGKGWTFTPRERHVIFSPGGDVAWFDERLDSASYGECRGSGVVRRIDGAWKVAHYNLTIPIPNELADQVVASIRAKKP